MELGTVKLVRKGVVHRQRVEGGPLREEVISQFVPPGHSQITDLQRLARVGSVAVVRDGHVGDILMLTAVLRELKQLIPHLNIHVFCDSGYLPLLDRNPHITSALGIGDYKPAAHELGVDLRWFVERHPEAHVVDRISLFAAAFGLRLANGPLAPEYDLQPAEEQRVAAWLEEQGIGRKRIAFGPLSRDPRRSWSVETCREFIELAAAGGWDVILCHHNEDALHVLGELPGLYHTSGLLLREVVALVSQCNAVVSTDTGHYHMGAAVQRGGVPYLFVTFTMVTPRLRMARYQNYLAILPKDVSCCPCDGDPGSSLACDLRCIKALDAKSIYARVEALTPDHNNGG